LASARAQRDPAGQSAGGAS